MYIASHKVYHVPRYKNLLAAPLPFYIKKSAGRYFIDFQ